MAKLGELAVDDPRFDDDQAAAVAHAFPARFDHFEQPLVDPVGDAVDETLLPLVQSPRVERGDALGFRRR